MRGRERVSTMEDWDLVKRSRFVSKISYAFFGFQPDSERNVNLRVNEHWLKFKRDVKFMGVYKAILSRSI